MQALIKQDGLKKLRGIWTFEFFEGDTDKLIDKKIYENLITTVGKQLTLDRLFGLSSAIAIAGMSVGTSNTAADVGDTSITSPAYKVFDETPTRSSLTVTCFTTYTTSEANINIQEVGLLTASGGVLFNRLAPIGPFSKSSAVSLKITVQITQT